MKIINPGIKTTESKRKVKRIEADWKDSKLVVTTSTTEEIQNHALLTIYGSNKQAILNINNDMTKMLTDIRELLNRISMAKDAVKRTEDIITEIESQGKVKTVLKTAPKTFYREGKPFSTKAFKKELKTNKRTIKDMNLVIKNLTEEIKKQVEEL